MRAHRALIFAGLTLAVVHATAQWEIQDAHTTASLRGIHYVGNGVAWASGTDGTVLRTEDMGFVWQLCTIPPGAEKLDFRGIQAFDNNTALVMSSGKGDLSRLYKTTDGCQTWKLVFTNPDKDGFWDAVSVFDDFETVLIVGDPVAGAFQLYSSSFDPNKMTFKKFRNNWNDHRLTAQNGQAAFAASNSLLLENLGDGMFSFITGGSRSEIIHEEHGLDQKRGMFSEWSRSPLPFATCRSCGAFAIATTPSLPFREHKPVVVVGGDYENPDVHEKTAAYSTDWGYHFTLSLTSPHGYRSAVGYSKEQNAWITVGPNGTDASFDDGRNWRPLKPSPGDAPDADQHWNALSLPFVVGPKGRIGLLHEDGLKGAATRSQ